MTEGKRFILGTAVLAAVLLLGLSACSGGAGESSTEETALNGTAAQRAVTILGREPSGSARKIVERGTLVVANDADYAPQSSIDKTTGELVGFDVDVALEIGEILGLAVEFENPAWENTFPGLAEGRFDVSIGSMPCTKTADKTVDFTGPYYYTSGQVFVKEGGTQILGVEDLAGKTVGVGAATTYYGYLKAKSDAKIKVYVTDADAFSDLHDGEIDFVMTTAYSGQQAILEGQPFRFSGAPLFFEERCFAAAEGEADWVSLLNYAIARMHENGSLTEMSKRWYGGLDLTTRE